MGYELKKLMNMYGVSTPTMAPAPQMPGAAPTALAEGATAEQQAKYATDKAAFDESVRKYGLDKAQYDQYAQEYQNRLANTNLYNQAQFSTTGANVPAFTTYSDAQKAALGYGPAVTPTVGAPTIGAPTVGGGGATAPVMPQPGPDASSPNPVANPLRVLAGETKTQYLERVKGMGAPGRGQNAPPGMMFGPNDALVPDPNYGDTISIMPVYGIGTDENGNIIKRPPPGMMYDQNNQLVPDPNSGGTILPVPQPGPQDFTGIGQGGLNQQIQSYMGTNPSMPDLNAYMTRYGITDYDMRNAMGTGTTYGAPQWTDMLKPPVYGAPITTMPVDTGGGTGGTTTGGTTPVDTGGTTTGGGTTGTTANLTTQGGGGRDRDDMREIGRPGNGTGTGSFGLPDPFGGGSRTTSGGYTGLRDMFDGGGPGRSGTRGGYTSLRDMFDGGGPGRSRAKAEGGYIQNYAQGGTVQGYAPGGIVYGGAGDDVLMGRPADDMLPPAPAPGAEDPLLAMYERYALPVDRSAEIAAAAERRAAEQKAFEELLMGQVDTQDMAPESKAEMYLRLAAAFGAPTKTGHFSENLALAGQTMADQLAEKSRREREARERKLGVQTELQKMRLETAREEEDRLLGLQEDEAKYGRELARDLIKDYINSGKPQTEAAKMASDMGLTPGTPEFNAKVVEIVELDIAEKKSLIDARLAMRDNVPAAFAALDAQARAAGFLPKSEGGDGSYEEFMATRGSGFAAEARVIGTARGEATASAPVDVATADKTLEYIEEIRNHPGKSIGTGGSSYLNVIRGTPGYGFQKRVDQLTSGAFLTAIEQLRGMGALSNAEGQTAKDAVTRMDTATSEEEFDAALSDYESVVKGAQERARARLQEPTAGTGADLGLSDEDLQYIGGD